MRAASLGLLVALLGGTACAGGSAGAAPAEQLPQDVPAVRAGDQLAVRIDREPELGGTFGVTRSGSVLLPRLGVLDLSDIPADEVEAHLRERYSEYLRDPVIEVTILRRVAIHGEVRNPGVQMVDPSVTLREVMAMAGGFTPAANARDVRVIRDGTELRISGDEVFSRPVSDLRSGDQIVVGRKHWLAQNPIGAIGTAAGVLAVLLTQIIPAIR